MFGFVIKRIICNLLKILDLLSVMIVWIYYIHAYFAADFSTLIKFSLYIDDYIYDGSYQLWIALLRRSIM